MSEEQSIFDAIDSMGIVAEVKEEVVEAPQEEFESTAIETEDYVDSYTDDAINDAMSTFSPEELKDLGIELDYEGEVDEEGEPLEQEEQEAEPEEQEEETEESEEESESDEGVSEEDVEFEDIDLDDDTIIFVEQSDGTELEVNFADLKASFRSNQILEQMSNDIKQRYEKLQLDEADQEDFRELAVLEADVEIETMGYDKMSETDWRKMSREDPAAYAQHRPYFESLVAKKEKLRSRMEENNKAKVEREREETVKYANEQEAIILREIPNADIDLVQEVYSHALNKLHAPESVRNTVVPAHTFIGWYYSMLRDKEINGAARTLNTKRVATRKVKRAGKRALGSTVNNKIKHAGPDSEYLEELSGWL